MINITRREDAPASLDTADIQDYIDRLSNYLADPINVAKPDDPPSYRNSDLLAAFDKDFFSKCYLTEKHFANSWAMDVEHFISKSENPALRFTWTNLLPADHAANMIKPRKTPIGGYFDPCNPDDDVEKEILYSLDIDGDNPKFTPADSTNVKAKNTCELLDRIHNGHDENTKLSTQHLKFIIRKKHSEVLKKIISWMHQPNGTPLKHQEERQLRDLLSRRSDFTMLMRSISSVIQVVPHEFLD